MDAKQLLFLIQNAKSRQEILNIFSIPNNKGGVLKLKKILYTEYLIDFDKEFKSKVENNKCKNCNNVITKSKKFCNSSCSAIFNNTNRKVKETTKKKISETLKKKYLSKEIPSRKGQTKGKIYKYICKNCKKEFLLKKYPSIARKTCSKECQIISMFKNRNYQNGSRKTFYYLSSDNKTVILESSWELTIAKLLDEKSITWTRPKSLTWFDSNNNSHQYYPDFYLPEYEVFLDPKNDYCMSLDKEKMEYIEKKYKIIYGNINKIIFFIENLTK